MTFWDTSKQIAGNVVFLHPAGSDMTTTYIDAFKDAYARNGIAFKDAKKGCVVERYTDVSDFSLPALKKVIEGGECAKAGLIILVLPKQDDSNRQRHANFHIVADQIVGKPSIAFCETKMKGKDAQRLLPYMANNAMKINLRLGNVNHTVEKKPLEVLWNRQQKCDTMILGADLIHPKSTSADGTPSIAAVVGSVDDDFCKFFGSVRRQGKGREYIETGLMEAMVHERIQAWQKTHKDQMLARILYYRDGVGNSQYDDILHHEVRQITNAWHRANKGTTKKPIVTTVVVTKRHNARFYPVSTTDTEKREKTATGNCIPGTVIDSRITSPFYIDFYLQSHDALKGSAKPTYYFVLENEMKLKAEELQDLTNALCYTFQHSTTAVSYVPPAYYADKLCERAALYFKPYFDSDDAVKAMDAQERQTAMDLAWGRSKHPTRPWSFKLEETMFYM
ncbi:hypothetical protein LTR85_010835 [Meristemomyces frigidus]|nr:hypothetical protein LTR85_010835 [Meristemomyces frigidus]